MRKRLLSILLSLIMVCTMFPAQTFFTFAEGNAELQSEATGELCLKMHQKTETTNTTFSVSLKQNGSVVTSTTFQSVKGKDVTTEVISGIADGEYQLEISAPRCVTYKQDLKFDGRCIELNIYNSDSVNEGREDDELFGVMPVGDVDGDNKIDDNDANTIVNGIESKDTKYDINGDGVTDIKDLSIAVRDEGKVVESNILHKSSSIALENVVTGNVPTNTKLASNSCAVTDVLKADNTDNTSLKLQPASNSNEAISSENPVSVELNISNSTITNDEKSSTNADSIIITPPKDSENAITEGTVEVEGYDFGNATDTIISFPIENQATQSGYEAQLMGDAAQEISKDSNGAIVINLGKRIAIKKVTICVTGTKNNTCLAEIAKVEFLSNFAERIPEPQLSIPTIISVSNSESDGQGYKSLTVNWNAQTNVTGYEVKVSGEGYNKTGTTDKTSYTFQGDSFNGTVKSFKTYNVQVRSVSGDWRSDWSTVYKHTVTCNKVPPAPESVSITAGVQSMNVSWVCKFDAEYYSLFYKSESDSDFTEIKNITTNKYFLQGLKAGVKYTVYVVAHNRNGASGKSANAEATPVNAEGVVMPKYKLLNVDNENNEATTHITEISGWKKGGILYKAGGKTVNIYDATPEDWKVLLDNVPNTYEYIDDWDSGVSYENFRGPVIKLDKAYKIDTIRMAPFEGCNVHLNQVKIGYYETNNTDSSQRKYVNTSFSTKYDSQNKRYYEIVFDEPITATCLEIRTTTGYSRNYTISEVKLYYYDSLEDDVEALFEDNMRTSLKDNVTQSDIDKLRERANTVDSVSGEYHPHKDTIISDLDYADKLLKESAKAEIINVDTSITTRNHPENGFAMGLSDYQPLGYVAAAGDTVVIYVTDKSGNIKRGNNAELYLIATQYHPEVTNWQKSVVQLKAGRNEIQIPRIGSYAKESGGSLYLQYTGNKGAAGYKIRVTNATKIPTLRLDGVAEASRTDLIKNYVSELETYVSGIENAHTAHKATGNTYLNYDYSDTECFLNSTEITMENMMYSVPAKAVWSALGNGSIDEKADNLKKSIEAMEQEIDYFYQFKGLNKSASGNDAYPNTRLNIRYHQMFTGAFMYAGGKHIGIEYGSVGGLFGLNKIVTDDNGKKTSGNLSGWGISHEIGHCINASAYQRVEVTNNMFAQLANTDETNQTGRWGSDYTKVYKAVATGTMGHTGDLAVQLAMYWQLHLAYDNDYGFKIYNNVEEQQNGLFYARLESYLRDKTKAPKQFTATGGDQLFMQAACAAANKDILDFFRAWGIYPDSSTVEYAAQFDKETRKIQYIDDDSRLYRIENKPGMSSETNVTATITNTETNDNRRINGNKVELTFSNNNLNPGAMLGYEIKRNGTIVAFVTADKTSYTDIVTTENNTAFTYTITAIDRLLNETKVCTLPEVKICHDGAISKEGWTATTNMSSVRDTIAAKTDTDPDSGYVDDKNNKPSVEKVSAISAAIDNNTDTVYYGTAGGTDSTRPYVILDLGGTEQVTALKFTPAKKEYNGNAADGSPAASDLFKYRLFGYKIEISQDGTNWTTVKQGNAYTGNAGNESSWVKQDDIIYNSDGSYTIYFNKKNQNGDLDPFMYTYDAAYIKMTASNMSGIAIAELDVLGPTNDNVDLIESGYGTLKTEYDAGKYSDGTECKIPAGSVVFYGAYKGDPAYNVVLLKDQDGNVLDGSQLFFAEVPEKGALGETSDGRWLFWLENTTKTDVNETEYNEFSQLENLKTVQVELYRVQDAQTLEGQRKTSSSLTFTLPATRSDIEITNTNAASNTTALNVPKAELCSPSEDMIQAAMAYDDAVNAVADIRNSNYDDFEKIIAVGNSGAVLTGNEGEPTNTDVETVNPVKFTYENGKVKYAFDANQSIGVEIDFGTSADSLDIDAGSDSNVYKAVRGTGSEKKLYMVAKTGNLGSVVNGTLTGIGKTDKVYASNIVYLDTTYEITSLNGTKEDPIAVSEFEPSDGKVSVNDGESMDFDEAVKNLNDNDSMDLLNNVIMPDSTIDKSISIELNNHLFCAKINTKKVNISGAVAAIFNPDIDKINSPEAVALLGDSDNDSIQLVLYSPSLSKLVDYINATGDNKPIHLLKDSSESINSNYNITLESEDYVWDGNNYGSGTVSTNNVKAVSVIDGNGYSTYYDNISDAISNTEKGGTIKLLSNINISSTGAEISGNEAELMVDLSKGLMIPADKSLTIDLNGYKICGDLYVYGNLILKDGDNKDIKSIKGEVIGDLVTIGGKITIKSGIFREDQNTEENNFKLVSMLVKDSNGNVLNKAYLIAGNLYKKWIVLPEGENLDFKLEFKVFTKDATNADFINPESSTKLVKNIDADKYQDFSWGEEYQAVVYLNTGLANVNVRSFDFDVAYPNNLMNVEIKANVDTNKYSTINHDKVNGKINYTLATNNYELKDSKYNPVAVINFTINGNDIKSKDLFELNFGKEAFVSTMDSINSIPVSQMSSFEGAVKNTNDGVNIVDYSYAPEGYKLAIISVEHEKEKTLKFNDNTKVYYTENEAYTAQSTNPKGLNLKGEKGSVSGVYLAMVKNTLSESEVMSLVEIVEGNDDTITELSYTGDIDRNGIAEANDASVVYQMLIGNTKWGYIENDSQLYIPTFQRLICEANYDGKLYGTIEDVNTIIEKYSGK